MTRRLSITSTSNDRLKAVRRLRRRRQAGVVLIEGHQALRRALAAGAAVREVYAAPELFLGEEDAGLVSRAERRGARVLLVGGAAFASISSRVRSDGLAALVERPPTNLRRLHLPPSALLVVAEGIERPGNLGTIVRTTSAAGADALIVCDSPADVFHSETVRGSVGTVFGHLLAETSADLALPWLSERGVRILVATPGGSRPYWETDYTGPAAVVVGSERHGVTDRWLAAAAETVRIPMVGGTDSVNVAVAAGVVLFEAARQRAARPATR
jgi:RNA methyltransferase, TrmH family